MCATTPTITFVEDVFDCDHALIAMADGRQLGWLLFNKPEPGVDANLWVTGIFVEDDCQRRGVATALMREFERRNPGIVIDHGERTDQGFRWALSYYGHNARFTRDGQRVGAERCAQYVGNEATRQLFAES